MYENASEAGIQLDACMSGVFKTRHPCGCLQETKERIKMCIRDSHNTNRLDVENTVKKIMTTDYVRNALAAWEAERK